MPILRNMHLISIQSWTCLEILGLGSSFYRSHMNCLLPLESKKKIEQTTETMSVAPKTVATATIEDQ